MATQGIFFLVFFSVGAARRDTAGRLESVLRRGTPKSSNRSNSTAKVPNALYVHAIVRRGRITECTRTKLEGGGQVGDENALEFPPRASPLFTPLVLLLINVLAFQPSIKTRRKFAARSGTGVGE